MSANRKNTSRRLKCVCGERKARCWVCSIGGYIFIHCPSCHQELRSENISDIFSRKDKKAFCTVQDKLITDWKLTQNPKIE